LEETPKSWIKLSSDGACEESGEYSGCGGLFRNSQGRWINATFKRLECVMHFMLKCGGMYLGLEMI